MQNGKMQKCKNAECRMQNAECKMQNAECRMQNAECNMQNANSQGVMEFGIVKITNFGNPKFEIFKNKKSKKPLFSNFQIV